MAAEERVTLVTFLDRYGRHHPTGAISAHQGRVKARVHYTSRTPVRRRLREASE